jgi:hypothetical protein
MNALEWLAHGLVILLLAAALPVTWRLNASLSRVRAERDALGAAAEGLGEATRAAEAALLRLRASAELAGRQVAEKTALAEPLREDLRFLIERGEQLADRLDGSIRAGRAPAETIAPRAPDGRSAAERQLLQALSGRG